MTDGWNKNWMVLRDEWDDAWLDFKHNLDRLKSPSLNPSNREHFVPHVLVAFISTFYSLRRTLTYLTVLGLVGLAVSWLW